MPTVPLPEHPNLDQLRKQAKELQRAVRTGDPRSVALVARHCPAAARPLSLSTAQLVLARHHGFPSWPRLRRHVEVIAARTWTLTEPPSSGHGESSESPAAAFLRLACLNFTRDAPAHRERAAQLLAAEPALPATSPAVAAACADVEALRGHLAADPGAATRPAAPHGWSPLMYQAYARHDPAIGRDATVATARLLLAAGADPNDGRFFLGLPTPFTVLTGVFAGATADQPAHPHAAALADVLLAAGADPNDGQTLYNRMFGADDGHLRVLFAHGLGRDGGGPWHTLLGDQLESPAEMLSALLDWAVTHDQRDRVALLAANGVDLHAPITARRRYSDTGRTPIELALLNGHTALAAQLRAERTQSPSLGPAGDSPAPDLAAGGSPTPDLSGAGSPAPNIGGAGLPVNFTPADAFVAAALAGDADGVAGTPEPVVEAARTARPGLIVWATALGRAESVELLAAAGFDVNVYGRADVPVEEPWQTALHVAAGDGDLSMARRLLALGADPDRRDRRFRATPLDWARHFAREPLIALLTPVTAAEHD